MGNASTVEEQALGLSTQERAALASKLLRSLPEFLRDEDEGIGEATRRRAEITANPDIGISFEELRERISERFDI
ncbi:MAG: addiction module protein [Acidobacteria bacterium]|nr:addiction module protein [Acidobacteriota bacterium]